MSLKVRKILDGKADGGTERGKSKLATGVQLPPGAFPTIDEADPDPTNMALASMVKITFDDDAKNLKDAMERSDWLEWKRAMEDEIALMAKYNVWVFQIKRNVSGKVQKYKVRLVAQGFTQIYGLNFLDNFAIVTCLSAIRAIITLAASEDWELHQMDVKPAYLNSPINSEINMRLPPGYGQKGMVAKLNRGLYRLRQSGNLWHKTLSVSFERLHLTRSATDHGVLFSHDSEGTTILCSSPDNFLITASSTKRMSTFKGNLLQHFEMTDLGELGWILGIRVKRNRPSKTISLSQAAYIDLVAELPLPI